MPSQKWINLRRLFKYTSPIIDLLEKPYLYKYGNKTSEFPTIYIVGAPRTGSTILYQLITNYLDVLYVDNLTELARNNLFFGMSLSQLIYGNKQHNSLYSDYGKTHDSGLHAPNEGLFWYRWLPPKKHYTTHKDLTKFQKSRLQQYHNAIKYKFHKPFVIKNLSFGMRLDLIKDIEPDAKIIHVTRDPLYTIQSIYLARKKEKWPTHKLWSIKPSNAKEIEKRPIFEQILLQVEGINNQIFHDAKSFGENYMCIDYEEICRNTARTMEEIKHFIACNRKANTGEPPKYLEISNSIKLNKKEEDYLRQTLRK